MVYVQLGGTKNRGETRVAARTWHIIHKHKAKKDGQATRSSQDQTKIKNGRQKARDTCSFLPLSVPLLVLLPVDADPNLQTQDYLSLSGWIIYEKKLAFSNDDVSIGSHSGWIVTIHTNLDVSLFDPFSLRKAPSPTSDLIARHRRELHGGG